tara:strand:- start:20 stop:262 length:243 start_codon:yes stop_codon:yes gene_type:complete
MPFAKEVKKADLLLIQADCDDNIELFSLRLRRTATTTAKDTLVALRSLRFHRNLALPGLQKGLGLFRPYAENNNTSKLAP